MERLKTDKKQDYSYSFTSSKSREEIYSLLLKIKEWWSGVYGETIEGNSKALDDEFTFSAGEGAHYSKHRLVELIPNRKIVWVVTQSTLSFLTQSDEWVGTKIRFELEDKGGKTKVIFTHEGLTPAFECYKNCAGAWTQYMQNLETKLNNLK